MKICTKCGETKPLEKFARDKRNKDGTRSHCRTCMSAYQRKHYANSGDKRSRAQARKDLEKVRCLHGQCMRPGKDQPEGLGFRFCDIHVHHARKILDNPTRAWSPAGYALPTKGSA